MSKEIMKYKGQLGSIDIDMDSKTLYGKLLHIDDLVTYEANNPEDLEAEFKQAVDEYIADCEELGIEPNKPFKGSFNVRIGSDLHRQLAHKATELELSMNEAVAKAIKNFVEVGPDVVQHYHNHTQTIIRRETYQVQPEAHQEPWMVRTRGGWTFPQTEEDKCH